MLRGFGLRLALLLASGPVFLPGGVRAQECPAGSISYIFIDNRDIFDTTDLEPDTPFLWAYKAANALHVRTKADFIRSELLFREGECLDPFLLEESERLLRAYPFISQSDVFAIPQPDGTQHVIVDTQDDWTTKIDLGFRFDGGLTFTGFAVEEENLLGQGIRVRVFYAEDREQRDLGFEVQTPRLMDTRWDARISAGQTRSGNFFEESLFYPFVGETGRFGARQSFLRRESIFPYAISGDPLFTHLLLPYVDHRWDLVVGGRLGEPGNLTVFGVGASRESIRFDRFPRGVEMVEDKNFADTHPPGDSALAAVGPQLVTRSAARINFFFGQRNLRFVPQRGLDAFKGVQDVQVGTEVFIGLGRAVEASGAEGARVPDDIHTQLNLFAGGVWDDWTVNAQANAEARQVFPGGGSGGTWKDVFAEADAYLYWHRGQEGNHTLLLRMSAAGGWEVETPFQLTLGGRQAVRGYREEEFPGGRRVVLTAEDRIYLPWPAPGLMDFGLSFFADVGFMRPGDVPFGMASGWRAALGTGIRFGLPPGTGNMSRIDLAIPLEGRIQLKDVVLRISLREILGILPGARDYQMVRSLRSGVRPTIISLPR